MLNQVETSELSIDQVIALSQHDFDMLFGSKSFPTEFRYHSERDVYISTNELPGKVLEQIKERKNIGKLSYFGILANGDSALNHIVNLHNPNKNNHLELAVLVDINENTVVHGNYRLSLPKVCKTPQEFFKAIFPADVNFDELVKFDSKIEIIRFLEGKKFLYDDSFMNKKMDDLKMSGIETDKVKQIMSKSYNGGWRKYEEDHPPKVVMSYDMILAVADILKEENHWLALNGTNYAVARKLILEGRIKTAQMPVQKLGTSKISKLFKSGKIPPLKYVYLSNAGAVIGDSDYLQLLAGIKGIQDASAEDNDIQIIYCVNDESDRPSGLTNVVKSLSKIMSSEDLRQQTRDKSRSPDILDMNGEIVTEILPKRIYRRIRYLFSNE